MNYDGAIHARVPYSLQERLHRVHAQTRIPKSELIRYFLSTGLDGYPASQLDNLAQDVAEDLHERGLDQRHRVKDHAAA